MKWLVIPWLIALAWFAMAYAALGDALDAAIATTMPVLIASIVTFKVWNTYRRWIADQAAKARTAEAMAWNLPEPGDCPANQNRRPRSGETAAR